MVIFSFLAVLMHAYLALHVSHFILIIVMIGYCLISIVLLFYKRYKLALLIVISIMTLLSSYTQLKIHQTLIPLPSHKKVWALIMLKKPLHISQNNQSYLVNMLYVNHKHYNQIMILKHYGGGELKVWPLHYWVKIQCQKKHSNYQTMICTYIKAIAYKNNHWYEKIFTFKSQMVFWIWQSQGGDTAYRVFIALIFGDRAYLTPSIWHVFASTGTAHLLAIAGLHLGVVVTCALFLLSVLWRSLKKGKQFIAKQNFLAAGAIVIAIMYALFTGFAIPCRRASIMFLCICLAELGMMHLKMMDRLLLALILIILFFPGSITSSGLWLSFFAVSAICYGAIIKIESRYFVAQYLRMSFVLWVGLLPWSLYFFGMFSITGLMANLIAIPWIAFIILPIALVSLLFLPIHPIWQYKIWVCLDLLFKPLWLLLKTLSALHYGGFYQQPLLIDCFLYMIGFLWLFSPKAIPGRYWAFLLMLPVILHSYHKVPYGDVQSYQLSSLRHNTIVILGRDQIWLVSSKSKPYHLSQWSKKRLAGTIGFYPLNADIQEVHLNADDWHNAIINGHYLV